MSFIGEMRRLSVVGLRIINEDLDRRSIKLMIKYINNIYILICIITNLCQLLELNLSQEECTKQ